MANVIEVRVHVNLPHDAVGQTASPGQTIRVDADNPLIVGYLQAGFLVPLTPLDFSAALQPPQERTIEDDEADTLADPDAPQTAATKPSGGSRRKK